MRIAEVIKPPTPEQARIKSLQAQAKMAQQRIKQERVRQQQIKLNVQRAALSTTT